MKIADKVQLKARMKNVKESFAEKAFIIFSGRDCDIHLFLLSVHK